MNKAQKREVEKTLSYGQHLGSDYLARSLSGLIRSALTNKQKQEIAAIAHDVGVSNHPEFIC
jgi:hypothetical protein